MPENRARSCVQAGKAGMRREPAGGIPRNRDQQSRPQGQRSNSGERPQIQRPAEPAPGQVQQRGAPREIRRPGADPQAMAQQR